MNYEKRKQRKRLMIEDRMIIQACFHDHRNISQIASRLGVNKSTISRELKINSFISTSKTPKIKNVRFLGQILFFLIHSIKYIN